MPLIKGKSKKSFEKNIATEVESGKPLKQSLAIAYDIQRKAKAKKAKGGMAENPAENASTPAFREYAENKMAEGGHVCSKCGHQDMEESDLESGSPAQKILGRKKFAKGGAVEDDMVDLDANNMEGPGTDRSYNIKAKQFDQGDEGMLSPQPRDSNLKGRKLAGNDDGDLRSLISKIMKKKKGA